MGLIKKIDSGIQMAIRGEKILTRESASPGAWTSALLPCAMTISTFAYQSSDVYRLCTVFAVNLFLNSILLLFHAKNYENLSVTKSLNHWLFIPVLVAAVMYNRIQHLDVFHSLCHSMANTLLYFEALPYILKVFPRAFTYGEANIAAQGVALFIFSTFTRINRICTVGPPTTDMDRITTVLLVIMLVVMLICLTPKNLSASKQYFITAMLLLSLVPVLSYLLAVNFVTWFLDFLFLPSRLHLMGGWAACSGLAWGTILMQIRSKRKAATDTRKVFHILAVLVFMSGALTDPLLLFLASGLVLPAFILIEFVRVRKLPPFAEVLHNGFLAYADAKDAGGVALTPIYLLIGCSIPLWLLPELRGPEYTLPLLSGVLSIGIGDSCASIVGKNFGKHKWLGTSKTIEGTIACVVGQAGALLVLSSLGYLPASSSNAFRLAKPLAAIVFTSIVEAKTDQIDNLVLPLITYNLLVM